MSYTLIIAAAGEGKRMNLSAERHEESIPKPYIKIKGTPIIIWTLKRFSGIKEIQNIIIVTHKDWVEHCKKLIKEYNIKKINSVIAGGKERQDSVNAGLKFADTEFVLIQDAVRPFVNGTLIKNLLKESKKHDAVIPGIPATNTLKEVNKNFVNKTVARDKIYEIQTPQLFKTSVLKSAYKKAYTDKFYATDDAMLVERLGIKVKVVQGEKSNIKITTPDDLLYAEAILSSRSV